MAIKVVRPINVKRLVRLAKQYSKEYKQTEICGLMPENRVHINSDYMIEVAPLDQWTLNDITRRPADGPYPYEHFVVIDGVEFFCITEQPVILAAEVSHE